jgi:elongation factor Ts
LPQDELDRQKVIIETQVKALNKPQQAHQKIVEGKLNKWYEQVCLLNQESIVVNKTPINKVIEDVSKLLGGTITVVSFNRFQVGEGLEKKEINFVNEVIEMASN